jgi:hypothetical protein
MKELVKSRVAARRPERRKLNQQRKKKVMKKRMRLSRVARAANRKRRLFKRPGVVIAVIPNRKTKMT